MSREIKFRVWDTHNNIWLDTKEFNARLDTGEVQLNGAAGVVKGIELAQYTGCSDKNSISIFEGDILTDNNRIWKVYFHQNHGCWLGQELNSINLKLSLHFWEFSSCTIIGNIYENPELLKEN